MKKTIFIIVMTLTMIYSNYANAFNEKATHPLLTENALLSTNLGSYFNNFLGFSSGYKSIMSGLDRKGWPQSYTVLKWLQEGSTDEDALNFCRASNHFHNPIHSGDWTQSQMSDSALVDGWCGTSNRYSDVTWATGFTSPAPSGTTIPRNGQANGWDNARNYYYDALTSTDPISGVLTRDGLFARTFRSLGMVIHLLQDMAVPAHVRNDMQSHLFNSSSPSRWFSNPFEKYVIINNKALKNTPIKPVFSIPAKLTDFWDTNIYNGTEPEFTRYAGIGLAEYANANFLSDFTIFNQNPTSVHYFPYPSSGSVSIGTKYIANPFAPGTTIPRQYYVKTSDGEVGYLLAGVDYLTAVTAPNPPYVERIPPLDNNVHSDYAQLLLPRAVGYSAALLDYFFRGKLTLSADPTDINFHSITVTAGNNTPGEVMGSGDVLLVIRYKALSETPLGGGKYLLNNPAAEYTYRVVIYPAKVDLSTPKPLTFDFGSAPLPLRFSDMTMQLVYRGPLGNEADSVAVSELKPIDGIYSDFAVFMPDVGVYAKTGNSSDNADFRELRVNVATDRTDGLTGGKFQLELTYRSALGNQFTGTQLDTEPADGIAYLSRTDDINGITSLQQNVAAELAFDLSSLPLSVQSSDVAVAINYIDNTTGKPVAIGVKNISEPNPVDVFNSTDYSCLNGQWYRFDDPAALAVADKVDIYPHTISNLSFLTAAAGTGTLDATSGSTLTGTGPLQTGEKLRLGYILTDYSNRYAYSTLRTGPDGDPWPPAVSNNSYSGTGFRNDDVNWSNMFSFRNKLLWWGTGAVFVNGTNDSSCTWDALQLKLGL